ncbi:hypothetical protein TRSC58_07444 [Trypanosoma rangeli SC58]|uniref:Uncharacterized protein n=1 Tax=Trypanosoma rangeli SC58 TaxID=429131 RepID=A0A061IT62_TRYRA|nr:hypothetical protein TRSC58_07444 [Trypanosoma rangeli SC58]
MIGFFLPNVSSTTPAFVPLVLMRCCCQLVISLFFFHFALHSFFVSNIRSMWFFFFLLPCITIFVCEWRWC